tara:strand:- start:404 stop:550 length:147 start_codon:yes stop_codon:yes gene_type:complete
MFKPLPVSVHHSTISWQSIDIQGLSGCEILSAQLHIPLLPLIESVKEF